ncbi:hypothetical protein PP175_14740 [Aneurinibacillus sp. Ricciae_BoGa-3]|uniref:hypothetical protein n=1 Tax=Aneurinibacillus sp. Ricciae_BoGa-3 TaxID=3022697 RepID=UPI00234206AC|nr:hypothetical protein [Aneurinibacillus sp. Ricciae_BoGa-3]WCK52687.1 hypothetical protein PP175_14740 [Aneurinibacillus sp. Ricciae_BoGa-3]
MTDELKRRASEASHPRSNPSRLDQFGRDGEIPVISETFKNRILSNDEPETNQES